MTNEVVGVGGGPTGLWRGCELRLAGVETMLERLSQPAGLSKALGLQARITGGCSSGSAAVLSHHRS